MINKLANIVGELEMGDNCRIDAFVTITGHVKIGNNVHIGTGVCIFGTHGVEIGDDCSISPGAKIFTSTYDSDTGYLANPQLKNKQTIDGPVKIGNRCIVGANSVVLPNVVLEDEVLIGCLSLVKTDLPRGIYAASPVREIHKHIH
jgi:acetyltransferase-like isoleucine patch superfamily enzyme